MAGEMLFFVIGVAVGGGRKEVRQPSSGVVLYEPDGDHDVISPFHSLRPTRSPTLDGPPCVHFNGYEFEPMSLGC